MSRIPITDRERVAVVALEQIAANGIVVRTKHGVMRDENGKEHPAFRCPSCDEDQSAQGPCLNRDCLTAIARSALDELRRLA